ncbi:MAG: hypothetical protein AAF829_04865 [Pseudomonadota bacterium]
MSSARTGKLSLAVAAMVALASCASNGNADLNVSSDTKAEVDPQFVPATDDEREVANRMPPLERANFWAVEYAKTPEDLDTALNFAKALATINSHERIIQLMTETEVIHPMSADVKRLKARSLSAMDNFAGARRALQAAAVIAPDDAGVLASLGLANDRLGDHTTAQVAYRQALEIDPERVATLSNYGFSLALSGDLNAAEIHLRRAMALAETNTNVQQNLALVLGLQGRFDEMMAVAGDAPADVMKRNADLLRALRGEDVTETTAPPSAAEKSPNAATLEEETTAAGPSLRRNGAG